MPKPFVVYRSSAGSGKTYTLTKEYLKLAFRRPEYFKHILAVTFTNKATKEMKVRILSVLQDLTKGAHPLGHELKEATGLSDSQLQQRAREILKAILHNYSYFSISTIDSFFQRVIRAFAREMGLQGGFRIELDEEQVLTEVIDKVLLEVGHNENLTNWLIKFAETRVDDGKPWDTRREIGNLAQEIFKEQFKRFEPEVLATASNSEFIPHFLGELKKVKDEFEGALTHIGQAGMKVIRENGLDVTDFAYKESGPAGFLEKLSMGKILAPGIRIESSAVDANSWSSKTNPLRAQIRSLAESHLVELLQEAVVYYKTNRVPYESSTEVLRYLYTYGILSDLAGKLDEYRDENELMLISDAAVFLKKIIADTEAPFVYEKVGSRFNHYLIDEFQDTSGFQWDNFRPLIENSLAENNYNLVVGDVKQSIYRWRGGDLDLLLEGVEKDIGSDRIGFEDLTQNWRSRQKIVDFNNSLFQFARELMSEQVKLKLAEVEDGDAKLLLASKTEKINQAYGEVIQECARQSSADDGGYLRFRFYPWMDKDGIEWKDNALTDLPQIIEELQGQKYALKDIAILVRTRLEGRAVVDHLLNYQSSSAREGYSYDVVSSESLYLENSSITRFLVACLKYIYKPDDMIQRVHMAYEWHRYIKPDETSLNEIFQKSSDQIKEDSFRTLFPSEFFEAIPELRKRSIYQLVEGIVQIFELDNFKEERAYLQGFLDAILDFSKTENDDILSFLSWWEQIGRERTVMVSEDQNAIRVMTIHMAKGLQFKAVIVPFCEWNMDGLQGFDNILWSKNEDTPPFDQAPYLPLNYSNKLKSTVFFKEFYEELIKSYIDNLNILYVAFTRAEEVLISTSPQHRSKGEIRVSSAVIDQYFDSDFKLGLFKTLQSEQFVEFSCGSYPSLGVEEVAGISQVSLDHFPSYDWSDRLVIKRSHTEDPIDSTDLEVDPKFFLAILRDLESINDLKRQLSDKLNEGLAHQEQREIIFRKLNEILSMDEIRTWFKPGDQVMMKAVILSPEHGELFADRLIYGDEVIKVIGFFLDAPGKDEIAQLEKAIEHFEQADKKAKGFFFNVSKKQVYEIGNQSIDEVDA